MSDRYKRQEGIIPQEALNVKVLVLGTGGVGTWVAPQLAMMGVRSIVLADDDLVDDSNLNRQFFQTGDLGRPKVDAMAEMLRRINPDVEVLPYPMRIEALEQIPEDIDIIMCGVDNYEGRFLMEKYLNKHKKVLMIDMGTNESATSGTVAMYMYGKTPSYSVLLGDEGVKAAQEEMAVPACSRNPMQAIVTATAMVATLGVDLFRQFISSKKIYSGLFVASMGRRPSVDFMEEKAKGWSG